MNWRERNQEKEIMDDLQLESEDLRQTLHDIAWINQHLGGHRTVVTGVKTITGKIPAEQFRRVVDVGCGLGDTLHALRVAKTLPDTVQMKGIDANPYTVSLARDRFGRQGLDFQTHELTPDQSHQIEGELLIFSLFLHHFSDADIKSILRNLDRKAVKAVLINDLQRHRLSHFLFRVIAGLLRFSKMARFDGALSIKKGFTKKELSNLMNQCGFSSWSIRWKWAFRFQVIAYV